MAPNCRILRRVVRVNRIPQNIYIIRRTRVQNGASITEGGTVCRRVAFLHVILTLRK